MKGAGASDRLLPLCVCLPELCIARLHVYYPMVCMQVCVYLCVVQGMCVSVFCSSMQLANT